MKKPGFYIFVVVKMPGNTEAKFQLLATLCKSTSASLKNKDTKNIVRKFKTPTQTYEAKVKIILPNFLALYFLSPDVKMEKTIKNFLSGRIYINFHWRKLQSKTKVKNISHEI